jgi:hypothetical protein
MEQPIKRKINHWELASTWVQYWSLRWIWCKGLPLLVACVVENAGFVQQRTFNFLGESFVLYFLVAGIVTTLAVRLHSVLVWYD